MYYRVISSLRDIPNLDHYEYGYDDRFDFQKALRDIVQRYGGQVGECIDTRPDLYRLRFADPPNPGAKAWIPRKLCEPAPPPEPDEEEDDPFEGVFGVGW